MYANSLCIIQSVCNDVLFCDIRFSLLHRVDPKQRHKERRNEARRIIETSCCYDACLKVPPADHAMNVVIHCIKEVEGLSKDEKKVVLYLLYIIFYLFYMLYLYLLLMYEL